MDLFTPAELEYLHGERRLGRLATVGSDGAPHVTPVGWRLNTAGDSFEIGGINLTATKKFRDVERTGRAALVIDDVLPPWKPRGVEIRGTATAVRGPEPVIRLQPDRIIAWGLDSDDLGDRHARSVASALRPRRRTPPATTARSAG
jgi:pyridoxamine 5'-phosphate oxidase family protein